MRHGSLASPRRQEGGGTSFLRVFLLKLLLLLLVWLFFLVGKLKPGNNALHHQSKCLLHQTKNKRGEKKQKICLHRNPRWDSIADFCVRSALISDDEWMDRPTADIFPHRFANFSFVPLHLVLRFLPSQSVGRSDRDIIRSGTRRTGVSNILCRMCHLIWSKTNKLYIMQQQEELLDAAEMEFGSFWFQSIDNGRHLTCCFLSAVMGRTAESSWAEHSSAHDNDPSTPSIPMRIVNLNRLLWVAGWMQGWEGIHKRHVILCPTRSDQVRSRFIEQQQQQQQLHADSFNHFLFREKDRRRRAVFFLSYLIILFRTWTDGAVCWEGE